MAALFRRKKLEPPSPPEEAEKDEGPFIDGSQTTYITGNRQRDTDRVRLLIDSLKAVSSEVDHDELLVSMVDRAVRIVGAERGLLFLAGADGKAVLRVARSDKDEDLDLKHVTFSSQVVQGVLEGGESVCKADDDGGEFDPSQSMISLNIRAVMCVPLVFRDQRQGAIYVDSRVSSRRFIKSDLRFFEAFADMLSIVWTNRRVMEERIEALRMQRDLELAREIQGNLIPTHPLHEKGYVMCGRVIPASEAGGDYFDFFRTKDDFLAMAVGDVSGHGAGPALFMSGARAYLRAYCQSSTSPSQILHRLNRHLVGDMGDDMFMSMFLCVLDPTTRSFNYANAGHPNPILIHGRDSVLEDYKRTGMALGVEAETDWGERGPYVLEPGDTVVMFTDGLLELRQGDEQYGRERLGRSILRHKDLPAGELLDAVIAEAKAWGGKGDLSEEDDITVAVLRADP